MAMGKVYWPRNQPWISEMMHEMLRFPAGVHDDMVDALSLIGRMMDNMAAAPEVEEGPVTELVPTTWGDLWENHLRRKKGRRSSGGIVMP
jgi:phage-related protein